MGAFYHRHSIGGRGFAWTGRSVAPVHVAGDGMAAACDGGDVLVGDGVFEVEAWVAKDV